MRNQLVPIVCLFLLGYSWAPLSAQTLTAYYNFEGNFNDFPGAGVNADNLVNVTGGSLVADPAINGGFFAQGSTQSYQFDNGAGYQTAQTNGWSADLAGSDNFTLMFWFKGDDQLQNNNNTRLISMRHLEGGGAATQPALQVEGFGLGSPNGLDLRIQPAPPPHTNPNVFSPDATGVLGNDGNAANDIWHHVAFVVTNSDPLGNNGGVAYLETFVDGTSVGLTSYPGSTGNPFASIDGELIVGGHNTANRGATGFLDDLAIFDYVLTDAEITSIATGTVSPADFLQTDAVVPEPASVAIWSVIGLGLVGFGYYRTRRKK